MKLGWNMPLGGVGHINFRKNVCPRRDEGPFVSTGAYILSSIRPQNPTQRPQITAPK